MYDSILEGIDKKKLSAIVLLDFSKAFDSINHNVLIAKLQDVGLSAQAIKWFNSRLLDTKPLGLTLPTLTSYHCPAVCPRGVVWVHFSSIFILTTFQVLPHLVALNAMWMILNYS